MPLVGEEKLFFDVRNVVVSGQSALANVLGEADAILKQKLHAPYRLDCTANGSTPAFLLLR